MKKLIIALTASLLAVSIYAMSKAPSDAAGSCSTNKACVKDAACCTPDGSCKMTKDATACAEKSACDAEKAVKEAGCEGGICPLKK